MLRDSNGVPHSRGHRWIDYVPINTQDVRIKEKAGRIHRPHHYQPSEKAVDYESEPAISYGVLEIDGDDQDVIRSDSRPHLFREKFRGIFRNPKE